jgi:hypothetical protein
MRQPRSVADGSGRRDATPWNGVKRLSNAKRTSTTAKAPRLIVIRCRVLATKLNGIASLTVGQGIPERGGNT